MRHHQHRDGFTNWAESKHQILLQTHLEALSPVTWVWSTATDLRPNRNIGSGTACSLQDPTRRIKSGVRPRDLPGIWVRTFGTNYLNCCVMASWQRGLSKCLGKKGRFVGHTDTIVTHYKPFFLDLIPCDTFLFLKIKLSLRALFWHRGGDRTCFTDGALSVYITGAFQV